MLKLKKDYEDEIKVFNVDTDAVIENLIAAGFTFEEKITTIDFFKSFGGVKFKMIQREKCVEIVRKAPSKKNKNARIENKKKFPVEILEYGMYDEMREMFIKILKLPVLFHGVKRRYIFHLTDETNISIDAWIAGELKGINYIEVECTDDEQEIDHIGLLKKYLPKDSEPRITRKGTLGVLADYRKCKLSLKKLNTLYKKVK